MHVWYIYLHEHHKSEPHVGKYTLHDLAWMIYGIHTPLLHTSSKLTRFHWVRVAQHPGILSPRTSIALIEASKTPNLEGWEPSRKNQDFFLSHRNETMKYCWWFRNPANWMIFLKSRSGFCHGIYIIKDN